MANTCISFWKNHFLSLLFHTFQTIVEVHCSTWIYHYVVLRWIKELYKKNIWHKCTKMLWQKKCTITKVRCSGWLFPPNWSLDFFFPYTNKEANSYTLTFIWYQTNRNWLDIITLLHKNWIHPLKKQLLPEKKPIKYKRPWDRMLSSELIVGFHWHYRIWYLSNLNLTSSWLPASENQRWGSQEGRATNT